MDVNADIDLGDNNKLLIGDGNDLRIYHNGSNSYIEDGGTGALIIKTNSFNIRNAADTEYMVEAIEGQGVKLFHSSNIKFETLSGGAIVRGDLEVTEDLTVRNNVQIDDNLNVDGTTNLDHTNIVGPLNVNGSATVDQITLDGNTVTASRFAGTADVALEAPVHGTDGQGLGNHDFALMMSLSSLGSGTVQKLTRDQQIKFNTGSNELRCDGDIAAFASDDRLKTNKVGISNALDKVNALSGFTYNWNEFASEQGNQFDPTKRFVGVSAQEVQKVLPEAVTPAPFNDEYLTVKYDKLVPLLIEAIKELSDKVSHLEKRLDS